MSIPFLVELIAMVPKIEGFGCLLSTVFVRIYNSCVILRKYRKPLCEVAVLTNVETCLSEYKTYIYTTERITLHRGADKSLARYFPMYFV